MIKAIDIFKRPEGKAFDLTQGVDIVDLFNAGVAQPLNNLESQFGQLDLGPGIDSEDSTADEDLKTSRQSQARVDIISPSKVAEPEFGFQNKGVEVGDFSIESFELGSYEKRVDDSNGEPLGARHTGNSSAGNLTDFVKGFEGWNPQSYADGKQRSIGFGTRAKKGERAISRKEGERRLSQELSSHKNRVLRLNKSKGYNFTSSQIDALTSFDYNT